jgi:hypothetical protein
MATIIFFFFITSLFAQNTGRIGAMEALGQNQNFPKIFRASLEVGIPHPQAALIQWTNGLLAFQQEPQYLFLKGYKPLTPMSFVLTGDEAKFSFFLRRHFTLYSGSHEILDESPDLDLKVNARDIMKALRPIETLSEMAAVWNPNELSYRLVSYFSNGSIQKEVTVSQDNATLETTEYVPGGFKKLQITQSDWQQVGDRVFPHHIKIQRFVPLPSGLILKFKEVRPEISIEARILNFEFPEGVEKVQLG